MSGITITVDHKKRIQIEIGCGAIHLPLEDATALRDSLSAAIGKLEIAIIKDALEDYKNGDTYPIETLWDGK